MAYLAMTGAVAAIITEDSDLLLHGRHFASHSHRPVLFKLDRSTGFASAIRPSRLAGLGTECISFASSAGGADGESVKVVQGLARHPGFSHDVFRRWCILPGCDYTRGFAGLGLRSAAALLLRLNLDFDAVLISILFDVVGIEKFES